jgi:5'-AMP-activated protein kinase catalytic alpha subunit
LPGRDIKLENILLDLNNQMKLIDFGLSAFFIPGKKLRVHCGTSSLNGDVSQGIFIQISSLPPPTKGSPSYAAPEIVARKQYDGPPTVRQVL